MKRAIGHRGFQPPPTIQFAKSDMSEAPVRACRGVNWHPDDHSASTWASPDGQRWCWNCFYPPGEVVESFTGIKPKAILPPTQLLETIDPATVIAYAWAAPESKSNKKEHA